MRIPLSLLVLFVVLAEIAVFILVGDAIGVGATLGLAVLFMFAGALLLKRQGAITLRRIRDELAAGRVPARPVAEGAVLAFAGLLMIVPGFLTDAAGVLLFVPAVRSAVWRHAGRRLQMRTARRDGSRSAHPAVLELDQSEYAASAPPDTPWRPEDRPRR